MEKLFRSLSFNIQNIVAKINFELSREYYIQYIVE